jgi:hypothetical protein
MVEERVMMVMMTMMTVKVNWRKVNWRAKMKVKMKSKGRAWEGAGWACVGEPPPRLLLFE